MKSQILCSHLWKRCVGKIAVCLSGVSIGILLCLPMWAQNVSQFERKLDAEFKKRLQQLVDEKTQEFFADLTHKEKFLSLLTEGVMEEVKRRDKEGFQIDRSRYNLLFAQPDPLIQSYKYELQKIVSLWDRLKTFEKLFTRYNVQQGLAEVESLKKHLLTAITGCEVKQPYYSPQLTQQLIHGYKKELEKIVRVFLELEQLRKQAQTTGPSALDQEIVAVKQTIAEVLAVEPEEVCPVEEEYFQEVMKVALMLQELDEFKKKVTPQNVESLRQIAAIKEQVLQCVDWDLLRALGYSNFETLSRPTCFVEIIEEWKASQLLWYKATLKQVELLKADLITHGSRSQLERMLKADLECAIQVYAEEDFPVAELLFQNILGQYRVFKQFDDVEFYLAESCLVQGKYERAQRYYISVTEKYLNSEYAKYAFLRLMLISQTFHRSDDVIEFFASLSRLYSAGEYDETFEKATYLVGYVHFSKGDFQQAINTLQTIPKKCKYFPPSVFLVATSKVALGYKDKAIPIYRFLSKEKNYSHKDALTEILVNNALLKLGLLYYEKGDLAEALRIFERISDKFDNYHVALIAKAWTEFRLGHLKYAINDLDMLFWNYLSSNYLYEAMMLSAHCNQILGRIPEAMRELRYVESAKQALVLFNSYNDERRQILDVFQQLSTLEERVLVQGDHYTYHEVKLLRDHLLLLLQRFDYRGYPGVHFVEEADVEYANILGLVQKLQDYQRITETLGYSELRGDITKTKNRLLQSLEILQKFKDIEKVDILADYPLAQRQSELKYRQQLMENMETSLEKERQQIDQYRKELSRLIKLAQYQGDLEILSKLEFKQEGLGALSQKLEVSMVFISESQHGDLDTDFEKWSDFSGFGVSDLDFMRMRVVGNEILVCNENVKIVNDALKYRQQQVLLQMEELVEQEKQLQEQLLQQKVQEIKEKRREYFQNQYFDTRTSEVKRHPEDEIQLLENEASDTE